MSDHTLGMLVGFLACISPVLLFSGVIIGIAEPKKRRLAGTLCLLGGVSIFSAYQLVRTLS